MSNFQSDLWRGMLAESFHPAQWYDRDYPGDDCPGCPEDRPMWVYKRVANSMTDERWAVGYYSPSGEWNQDCILTDRDKAAARVHYLNGGGGQ